VGTGLAVLRYASQISNPMSHTDGKGEKPEAWFEGVHQAFRRAGVGLVAHVPDAGLKELLVLCREDPLIRVIPLTSEEEGIGLAMGAWLGGEKCAVLLQSSGVGNLPNALAARKACAFPLFMLVTMRGEEGEFNPWQLPMGEAAPQVLETMGVEVRRCAQAADILRAVENGLKVVFRDEVAVAVLVAQSFLGVKSFRLQSGQEGERP